MGSLCFQRFAALAEVLAVLVLGNVIGLGLFSWLVSPGDGTTSPEMAAVWDGVLIVLRLGSAAVLGFALLSWRRRVTPRQAGLTRNDKPLTDLVRTGLLLGAVTVLPVAFLFAVHALVPFGEGLAAWWTYPERDIDTVFWIGLLATSVFIPPLVEEILFRGYQRVRLVESYGVMGGVVLTGLVFAFSHTRYLVADPMLLLFLLCIVFSSICWTYLAQKTGSVIPPMVAHAVTNGTATAILFEVWVPVIVLLVIALAFRKPIISAFAGFVADCRTYSISRSLWTGLGSLAVVVLPGLALLPILGRLPTLITIGAVLLLVTLVNLYLENRSRTEALDG